MLVLWLILILSLLVYLWSRRRFYILSWKLKGHLGLPFLGMVQLWNTKYVLKYSEKFSQTYKTPTTLWLGPLCFLYVNDPENIKRVLKAPECINRSIIYKKITQSIGDGLLSNNNPTWAHHRKLINPVFNHKTLMSFFPIFNAEVNTLRAKLNQYADTNEEADIKTLLERFTLSITTQTTMGTNTNMQNDENNQIVKSVLCIISCTSKQALNIFYYFDWFGKILDSKFFDEKYKAMKHVKIFVSTFIFGKLYNKEKQSNSEKAEDNCFTKSENIFVDHIVDLYQKELLSMDEVMAESNHLIIGAFETTATTIHYITVLLAIHPEWQEKLHDEIMQVLPHKDDDVLFEHLKDVPLAEMIINETLRLFPLVPLQARITDTDFQLNEDILVPKGTNIALDTYSLHRNPKYWGPDALEFNPYRFLPDVVKERHPYTFLPFSKGFRNCIGWRYAYLLVKVFVIKIFRNYRFTTTTKMEEIELYFDVVSRLSVNPVIKVKSRLE